MQNWIQEAISRWNATKVKLNPPASLLDIEKAELALNFKFSEDFKQLYLVVNGFEDCDWQQHMFSFWSLDRILNEYKESDDKDFIGFCDFLICSHFIGFDRNNGELLKNYEGHGKEKLEVQTLKDAVIGINADSKFIY